MGIFGSRIFFVKFFSRKLSRLYNFFAKMSNIVSLKILTFKLSFFKIIGPNREFFSADFDCAIFLDLEFLFLDLVLLEIIKFQCIPLALFYLSDQTHA